jgi:hypothetical protein
LKSDIRTNYKALEMSLLDHQNAIREQGKSIQKSVLDAKKIKTILGELQVGASIKL